MKIKNIVLVDDHVLIAKALERLISAIPGYSVLSHCSSGKELQEYFLDAIKPDIVLLDVSMPEMDGFETAAWLKKEHPSILILALSMQDDDYSVVKMFQNGAKGYLLKNSSIEEFEFALNELSNKGYFYSEWSSQKLLQDKHASEIILTEKEIEFLKYSVSEHTYKEIAEIMICSPRTVEGYRDRLFEKLGLKTRVGLALYAYKHALF